MSSVTSQTGVCRLREANSPLCTTPGHRHLIGSRPDNKPGRGAGDNPSECGCSTLKTPGLMPTVPGGSHDCKSFEVDAVTDYHALGPMSNFPNGSRVCDRRTMEKGRYKCLNTIQV